MPPFRNRRRLLPILALAGLCLFPTPAGLAQQPTGAVAAAAAKVKVVPTPTEHWGFRPGDDNRLVGWKDVVQYYRKVDAASDRVIVLDLGDTTEERPYLVAVVTSEANQKNLVKLQACQKALADPRRIAKPEDEAALLKESKTVVLVTCTIHSDETASTLMSLHLLHELAASNAPEIREILDNTVLLLVPSANPDGVDKIAQWYERSKGRPWEGRGMPWLYHTHAGHDTNRDWFMLNLKETQILTKLLYQEWFPTITYDVHQMGNTGARMFVPPFFDPVNPNLHPKVSQGIFLIGAHMAYDLASAKKQGVLTNAMYDNWWNGGCRTVPQRHNMVGVLTEAASVRLASPVFQTKADLKGGSRGFADHDLAVNFTNPWPGGWWRLNDIIEYEWICAKSVLKLAARYHDTFQRNYLDMGRDAIEAGKTRPPYAWIAPADQDDPARVADMARILRDSGLDVLQAQSPFKADGLEYPAGSWIFPAAQPYRPHLKDLMERQVYPDRRNARGEPETPYDVAGWTLPFLMGVKTVAAQNPVVADALPVTDVLRPQGRWLPSPIVSSPKDAETDKEKDKDKSKDDPKSRPLIVVKNRANDDFRFLTACHKAGLAVSLIPSAPHPAQNVEGNPSSVNEHRGSLLIDAVPAAEVLIEQLSPVLSTRYQRVEGPTAASLRAAAVPVPARRLAVYQPWQPSMDEGWTRLILDNHAIPYATVHNAEIRAGRLKERFDVLLIPSISPNAIKNGFGPEESEPAYTGGLGDQGADAIKTFIQAGGRLVCLDNAADYGIELFPDSKIANVLKGLGAQDFYAPGSLLNVEYPKNWLTVGMPARGEAYFSRSGAFRVPNDSPTLLNGARYASRNPLASGWLLGADKIQGQSALVSWRSVPNTGEVVLFAFPPQYRGQSQGTFRLLFNALLMPAW